MHKRRKTKIIQMHVDVTSMSKAVEKICYWVNEARVHRKAHYICVSNVHMCMEVFDNLQFKKIVNSADMVVPDGKPLSIVQNLTGYKGAVQVRGEDLTLSLCETASQKGFRIGLYGGTEQVLNSLNKKLLEDYSGLNIVCKIPPPFRPLTETEDNAYIKQINDSEVDILFVGIGCPKQENWMYEHREKLNCVMIGIGAAFDFISGHKAKAPRWMQRLGLEWSYRLITEPKRLLIRYAKHNPRFIAHATKNIITKRRTHQTKLNHLINIFSKETLSLSCIIFRRN